MASTHKSLRSGTANKRPTTSIADGQIALNTNTTSPGLFFKDSTGATIIKVGPVHVGTTAPNASPAAGGSAGNSVGEIWLDTSLTPVGVKIWNGSAFVNATPIGSTTVQGLLELATSAETQAGSDTDRAVTPAGLQSKVSDSTSTTSSTTIASSTAVKSAYDLANAALPKSGGTVTGNLEIGTTGSLSFEGATADAFETTIAVVDPTADRTITLPDTTGTIVTTGDTGTVTSTMIADGTIVNGDINASAAIAGTKISPDFGSQTIATTGIVSHALGTAAAPTVTFTGDTNTGIYSPGADQVAISTNGSGRLFVASDGKIGCGISAPSYGLQLINSASSFALGETGSNVRLVLNYGSPTSSTAAPTITSDGEGLYYYGRNGYSGQHIFYSGTSNTERLRITSAGLVGVGTASPGGLLHCALATTASPSGGWTSGTAVFGAGGSSGSAFGIAHDTTNGTRLYSIEPGVAWRPIEMLCNGLIFKSTNNSEAARFDTVGRLLVGISSARTAFQSPGGNVTPVHQFEFNSQTYNGLSITHNAGATTYPAVLAFGKSRGSSAGSYTAVASGDGLGWLNFYGADGTNMVRAATISAEVDNTPGASDMPGRLVFSTTADGASSPTERLRITSAGLVGIGTSSPEELVHIASTSAGALVDVLKVDNQSGTTNSEVGIVFENGTDRTARISSANTGSDIGPLKFWTAGSVDTLTERMRITSSGNVGIGTTLPGSFNASTDNLVIAQGSGNVGITLSSDSSSAGYLSWAEGVSSTNKGWVGYEYSSNALVLGTNQAERARIDSSGRLLVGTSSASTATDSQYSRLQIVGHTGGTEVPGRMILRRNEISANISISESIGEIYFGDNQAGEYALIKCEADSTAGSNDYPGRLVFSTTADGASSPTERMRIGSTGHVQVYSSDTQYGLTSLQNAAAGTTARVYAGGHSATGVNSGTISFTVWSNGDVQNTNNSYTALSDIKLKENIADANSQWADLKALRVRNYNLKEGQTHKQIGLIAQEVEPISPGLVYESPDRDADGNDLGTVTKSVNYSVLYMKAVKALQEAMERIETLEAKVAALESA